jgi:hypothetical protein
MSGNGGVEREDRAAVEGEDLLYLVFHAFKYQTKSENRNWNSVEYVENNS